MLVHAQMLICIFKIKKTVGGLYAKAYKVIGLFPFDLSSGIRNLNVVLIFYTNISELYLFALIPVHILGVLLYSNSN